MNNRWKNLKDAFTRAWRKRSEHLRGSGRPGSKLPTCAHFESLLFIKDSIASRTNKASNCETENSHIGSSSINLPVPNIPNDSHQQSTSQNTSASFQSPPFFQSSPVTCSGSRPSLQSEFIATNASDRSQSSTTYSKPGGKERAREKRKAEERRDEIDALLVKTLATESSKENLQPKEDSSDMLFCKSIAPILEKLPKRKNRKARLKIQEVLFELEESDSE